MVTKETCSSYCKYYRNVFTAQIWFWRYICIYDTAPPASLLQWAHSSGVEDRHPCYALFHIAHVTETIAPSNTTYDTQQCQQASHLLTDLQGRGKCGKKQQNKTQKKHQIPPLSIWIIYQCIQLTLRTICNAESTASVLSLVSGNYRRVHTTKQACKNYTIQWQK